MTTAYLLVSAYLILLTIAATTARAADPSKGSVVSQYIVATWKCQDQLGEPRTHARSPWKHHSPAYWNRELHLWAKRLKDCRDELHRIAYEWNWQAWLPDKWRRIGICETGLNWQHQNSSYISAFGISVQSYDDDADYMGVRHWYVSGMGVPTPWEQYQAALGHYRQHGGFSGWGCRGA